MGLLRKLFGASQEEVWMQLAAEMNKDNAGFKAEFVDGGTWKGDVVKVQAGEWTLTLDTFMVSTGKTYAIFTRLRAPYVNPDGFRFKITRANFFTNLGKKLGMQDIEIGQAPFDDAFVIQGTDEAKVRRLLSNAKIRELFVAQPDVHLEVKDDEGWFGATFPEGVDELSFYTGGVITDVERLKQLFLLFAEILHQLCAIGSAYEDDPQVTL